MAIKEFKSLNFGGEDTYVPVQSDWNQNDENAPDYIKNKPFYEKREVAEGDTIYWDGNIEGREEFDGYWWVSDAVPTMADFANGAYIDTTFDGAGTVASDQISDSGSGFIICFAVIVVYGDVDGMRKGTYLSAMSFDAYVSSLTIPGYTGFVSERVKLETIEPKYLPNALKNPGVQGAVSTSDICAVAKSEAFYLNVGEITYQELNNLCYSHVIYDIRYEGKTYLGLQMSVSGYSGGGVTYGTTHIVAIDYDGFPCTIDIKTNNASDWDSLDYATVATVNVTYPMNRPT